MTGVATVLTDHILVPFLVGALLVQAYVWYAVYDMVWVCRTSTSPWDEDGNERSDLSRALEQAESLRWWVLVSSPILAGIVLTTCYNALRGLVILL